MSNKFNDYKQSLVNFFEAEGYLIYGKIGSKKPTYLYSKDAKISVIKIAFVKKKLQNKLDQQLEYLKQEIAEQQEVLSQAVNVLEIYLSDNFENNFVRNDNTTIVITNNWDYLIHSLGVDFPSLENLEDPELTNVSESAKMTNSDFNLDEIKSPEDLKKRLSILSLQLRNGNSLATMIIAIFFLIAPFVIAFSLTFVIGVNVSSGAKALLFGGSTYTLTFLGGQWWRILTYGFGAGQGIIGLILMAFVIWMGFKRLRLNELMMGTWKMLGTFLLAYLMTGFFLSVLSAGVVSGSDPIAFSIIIGMIALNVGGSKSALASTAKRQLVGPIFLLVVYGLMLSFTGQTSSIMSFIIGFIAGGTMSFMVNYDYKELNWRLGVGIVLVLAFILVPVAMLIVKTYLPGVDPDVISGLEAYIGLKFMNVDKANNIIDKIGWNNIKINQVDGYIWVTNQ